jgi:phenylalanyl-tRNA synthetase alpha chain
MKEQLQSILTEAKGEITRVVTMPALQDLKAKYLGKTGIMSELMKGLKDATIEEKIEIGSQVNLAKDELEALFEAQRHHIDKLILEQKLAKETIDVTLPGNGYPRGALHPLHAVIDSIEDLFIGMGYQVEEGPEVESDEMNFEMLNLPKNHPARDMQDSFYITDTTLLRTHTSPVQIRTMLAAKGQPIKIICPGKVYRRDDDDATHSHQFTQIEGLVVDKNISIADLKGTLEVLVKHLFGKEREIRLRPSYFPFTEPSMEVDVSWGNHPDGTTKWMEILGAGMVHPNVLRMSGYDPEDVSGFAFGLGVERIAMLQHHIDDIRHFYINDQRFLDQLKGGKL